MSICTVAAFALTLCVSQPPFEVNPDNDRPEAGQRVAQAWRPVAGMATAVEVDDPVIARISGHLGFQIADRGGDCRSGDRFLLVISLTLNGRRVDGTQAGENVSRSEHYHDAPFSAALLLDEPGRYVVRLEARAVPKGDHDCRAYIKERQYSRMQVGVAG